MSEFRWLIEAPGQNYLACRRLTSMVEFIWTKDHHRALGFISKEQAGDLMLAVRDLKRELFGFEQTLGNAVPVEHGWIDGSNTEASNKSAQGIDNLVTALKPPVEAESA